MKNQNFQMMNKLIIIISFIPNEKKNSPINKINYHEKNNNDIKKKKKKKIKKKINNLLNFNNKNKKNKI